MNGHKKLNLGCGKDHKPQSEGWINVDIKEEFHPDLIWDLSGKLPYHFEEIEQIHAKDILEHFAESDAKDIFRHWVDLLMPGGIIETTCPDIEIIVSGFKGEQLINLIYGEPLFMGVQTGIYGVHKYGYTKETIKKLFESNKLEILELKNTCTNIYCKGKKK